VPAGAQGLNGGGTSALALDDLRSHIGRTQAATDVLHPGPANLLRLALGRAEPEYREGDPLPPAWLALYFLPRVAADALGPDGSPHDVGVVPAVPLPRRMFAGERVRVHRDLRIGETVRRETRLADVTLKHGGTGTLVFATVTSAVFGAGGLAIEDERRTVFRDEVKPGERNQAPRREPAPTDAPWRRRVTPDPILLFRYSALTFNSHRIHYDRAWATQVEGYPGLVVHGPLTTTLLLDFARDQNPGRRIVGYTTQARAPLFDDAPFELCGRPAGETRCELWAVTPGGTVAMSAEVELAEPTSAC
jgi:3-methylfumaryl-CoA hydratase